MRRILQVLVFGSAATALFVVGQRPLATAFIAVVVLNAVLMVVWKQ